MLAFTSKIVEAIKKQQSASMPMPAILGETNKIKSSPAGFMAQVAPQISPATSNNSLGSESAIASNNYQIPEPFATWQRLGIEPLGQDPMTRNIIIKFKDFGKLIVDAARSLGKK